MKNWMKLAFFICGIVLVSCTKFEAINDDNELFKKLSKDSGTWRVTKIESWDATEINPVKTVDEPSNSFFYFYLRSEIIFGNVVQLKHGRLYENDVITLQALISAQKERVEFEGNTVGSGHVFTVEEEKSNSMIWLYMFNDQAKRYYIERCYDCDILVPSTVEIGG